MLSRLAFAGVAVLLLGVASLFLGVSTVSVRDLFATDVDSQARLVLLASRVPRTLALVLAGAGMAVSGAILQMLARNRFVEPSTSGTVEWATLGMLAVMILAPDMAVFGKMLVAAAFALAGTGLFFALLQHIPLREPVIVPLIGIMLGGVVSAGTTFIAYRYELSQSLAAWTYGDFSTVLRGRYEMLWLAGAVTLAAYGLADQMTVAGMGADVAVGLGLAYRRVLLTGLALTALVSATVVVTVGIIPFVGLIVPNLVHLWQGDRLRRSLPWITAGGAALVLVCDMIGRTLNAPYEIPVGSVLGVVGSLGFLALLLRRSARAG